MLALVAAVLGALALRVIAIDYGLPAIYNPDEIAIMSRTLAFAKGDLNPHNFLYPTFYFYALFAWLGAYFVLARLTGQVASLNALQQQFFVDPSAIFVAGRAMSAVAGALTTGATALLGRSVFDQPTALCAAVLLAVAPLAVQDSHYVKHDVPATLVVTLALWRIARCWPEGGATDRVPARQLVGAAVVCGVAWSIHYYCVFLAVPLAITVFDRRRTEGWRRIVTGLAQTGCASLAVFFALSPFLLVEPGTAWRDILANRAIVVDRAVNHGMFGNVQRYLVLLTDGVTLPVVALAAIGAVRLAVTDARRALLLLSFPVPFLLFISNTVPATRYLNPILPIVALLAALTIRDLAVRLTPRRVGLMVVVLTMLTASGAVVASVRGVRFFAQQDTRTVAQRVIEAQVPDGATVLIQPYSVQLAQSRASLEESLEARRGSEPRSTRARLRLAVSPWPVPSYRLLWLGDGGLDEDKIYLEYGDLGPDPLRVLKAHGVEYVVLKRYNEPDPATRVLADILARQARLVATISPYRSGVTQDEAAAVEPFQHNTDATIDPRLQRPGPVIDIFQIR
jgi:hypothetical protein